MSGIIFSMHIHFLDPYRQKISPVHNLDSRVKLVLTLAFISTCALTPTGVWPVYILLFSFVFAVEILSELGVRYILKRSLLAAPFILSALPLLFTTPGEPFINLALGEWSLSISLAGMERAASIALKSWLSVQAAVILSASTPFPDLLLAMRAVKMPRFLVAIVGLMWRYMFVLADEGLRLMRARAARSSQSDQPGLKPGGSVAWRARVTGGMIGNLFLRGFERSDRIYMAMLARGYDGEVRSLPLPPVSRQHWLVFGVVLVFMLILVIAAFML